MVEWLSPVLYTKVTALFWVGFTLLPKPKHEKKHGTINWKFSNARKTQNFTCWALTKIRPYCLRTLKPTAYRICWKLWMSRFALRKKKGKFGKTDIKTRNLAIPNLKLSTCSITKSFYRTVTQEKNGSEGNKALKKHAGVIKRTDEGAGYPVGTSGMNIVVAPHEKQVSKGFDRNS